MKYIIIVGDGMADYPLESLGGKTPLQAADKPNIDRLCRLGRTGFFKTIPDDMPAGSAVANLAVLGYDVHKTYEGRGVLEAASMGVKLADNDLALRCNLICVENGRIKNHSAGHISTEESKKIIETLSNKITDPHVTFHPGASDRHLTVIGNGSKNIKCTPPHDVPGETFDDKLVAPLDHSGAETAALLNYMINYSQDILKDHPVNRKRIEQGKDPANSVWFWSPGYKPKMKTFQEQYGLKGAVISAVDLVRGIGVYAGFDVIEVEGITGLYDTNYEGKTQAALDALKTSDIIYLHIEASDEAGHEGDAELKVKTIEYLDKRVVKTILEETAKFSEPVTIALLPDHATPCTLRTHTRDPIPFIIYNPALEPDPVIFYSETMQDCQYNDLLQKDDFIQTLINR